MSTSDREAPGLRRFFDRYAELSMNAPTELAPLYGPTFVVGGPQGSMAFANDQKFLEWLAQVHAFNQQHGMRSLEVVAVRDTALSPRHALATVRWGARFEKTGDRRIEFEISYLLEGGGDDWKILSYISREEQNEEMQKLGLL